jgi:IS30 family transposase
MWNRWQQGDSLHAIARLLDTTHTSVRRHLVVTGGIRPPQRRRSRQALTPSEREEISRGIVAGHSIRCIAKELGRAPSTVSRELRRNGGRQHYRANVADDAAWDRARRPKTCKLARNPALALIVARQLKMLWSPEQIAGWLKRTYPDDENY